MNSFKQSGNYVYHLLQHSTALPFIHRVLMRFMSDTHSTNRPFAQHLQLVGLYNRNGRCSL